MYTYVLLFFNYAKGEHFALKELKSKNAELITQAKTEMELFRHIHHENLIRYIDAFEQNGFFYTVLEIANKGDLGRAILKRRNGKNIPWSDDVVCKFMVCRVMQCCKVLKLRV